MVGTGNDKISFKKALDRINRRQLDEIGTEKSREKPINILDRKIKNLENEKKELEKYKNLRYEIEENKKNLEKEIANLKNENDFLKEIKIISEEENLEKEKIKIKEKILEENIDKINLINNEISEMKNKNISELKSEKKINNKKNKLNKKIIIYFLIIILFNILQFFIIKNKLINYILISTIPAYLLACIIIKNKLNKKIKINNNIEKNDLINLEKINNKENEKNILEKNNKNLKNEINNLKNNLIIKINSEKEKIKNNYLNKIEKDEINILINAKNVNLELEKLQNEINDKIIKLNTLEIERKNIEPKLENLSKMEEELVNNNEKMSTLKKVNFSFELAKEILEKSYEEMKNNITPKFTNNLSKTISEITNQKYKKIAFNDEKGLIIELDNGNYVPASKLSIGTIDQLYLSLRLSMADELSKEKMPIILDEVFAYYDNDRLLNTLKYINTEFKEHQVIIFTCTNREKEILKNINIDFNLIEI